MTTKEEYLTPRVLEEQEHLSPERLAQLAPTGRVVPDVHSTRPSANFIDLMNWTAREFQGALKDRKGLEKFVHNRIIIDGQFLRFAEENGVTIECLYKYITSL